MGIRRSRPPRHQRIRARMALVACVLWLAGFELLPWLHIATHDHVGKHHHDASGAIIRDDDLDAATDEHADVAKHDDHHDDDEDAEVDEHGNHIEHPHAGEHRDAQSDRETRLRDAIGHGRHSLAHHDVLTLVPPPVLTTPLPVDRRPTFVVAITASAPPTPFSGRAVARGPPSISFES